MASAQTSRVSGSDGNKSTRTTDLNPEPDTQRREPGAGEWVNRASSVVRLTESGLKGQEGPGQSKSRACRGCRVPNKGTGAESKESRSASGLGSTRGDRGHRLLHDLCPLQTVHPRKENPVGHPRPPLKGERQSGAAGIHSVLHMRQGSGPTSSSGPEAQGEL